MPNAILILQSNTEA